MELECPQLVAVVAVLMLQEPQEWLERQGLEATVSPGSAGVGLQLRLANCLGMLSTVWVRWLLMEIITLLEVVEVVVMEQQLL